MQKTDVVHISSVHPRFDSRIFLKECRSLTAAGYRVALVVADGKGDEDRDGINICDVGHVPGRIRRVLVTLRRIQKRALELGAKLYHLHDPELLLIAGALMREGKVVVFDAHEDVPVQILGKPNLHPWVKPLISKSYERYESRVCRRLSAVVTSTPFIRDKFLHINSNSIDVNNYPVLDELTSPAIDRNRERHNVCYIGAISVGRGIREIVRAMELVDSDTRLVLCGRFEDERVRKELETWKGWERVDFRGWLGRDAIRDVLNDCVGGLVTLHPRQNYLDAHPIKMFEYMSAAVPVISSNFPLWRTIVEGNDCGLCVEPKQPQGIADAIDHLVRNPSTVTEFGENGRKAVEKKYNWPAEEKKLIELYARLNVRTDAQGVRKREE